MPKGKPVTAKDLNTFLERIAAGDKQTEAAKAAGQESVKPFFSRKDPRSPIYDPVFAQAYIEAVEDFLFKKREDVDTLVEIRAFNSAATTGDVTLYAKRWHPGYRDQAKAEEAKGADDDRDNQIAEALDRFTSAIVQLAQPGRAELDAGETDGGADSPPGLPLGGMVGETEPA